MTIKEEFLGTQEFHDGECPFWIYKGECDCRILEVWKFFESKLKSEYKRGVEEVIEAVESKLYTENGFFREDESVAPNVQSLLQDIKLHSQTNSTSDEEK